MAAEPTPPAGREQRLDEVLTGYLKAVDAGRPPDRRELLARHPELAPDLERFFGDQDAISRWTEPLRVADPDTPPGGAGGRPDLPLGSFGDYELLGVLGRGGMGAVYKARQRSLNRLVALKVIRAGEPADPAEVRRFRTEAEVVAGLEHPNIVPVYEVGERDGLFYLSMRLVEGGTLAGRLEGYAADPRAAARLVADVARAVHFAHQRGVLHRDLKPANVLLDADGRPLVTDFGLAKRVESESSLTQSGAIVGTPSYMAPEQASGTRGAVTTAADVWGLGALLYALLTGRPPFRGETVLETLEQLKGREPQPPGRLNRRVTPDLETVCLKCLEKEPARRYASAAELADDLARWLAGEPVRARRAGPGERALRWVRRRPTLSALLAVLALSVVTLVVGLLWHNERLWAEAEKTARERDAARKSRRAARRAVNEMYTRVAEDWLTDTPHMSDVQREFLAKALEFYEEVVRDPGAEPEDRLELGRALHRIAFLPLDHLRHPESEAAYRESVRVLADLVSEFPDVPEYRLELARSCSRFGGFLVATDQFPEAEVALGRARAEAEGLHRGRPDAPEYRRELALSECHLGVLFHRAGRLSDAAGAYRQARAQARWLVDHQSDVPRDRESLARALRGLGYVLFDQDDLGGAEQCFLDCKELSEALVRGSGSRPSPRNGLASALEVLGGVGLAEGKVEEAEQTTGQAVELRRRVQEDFPTHPPHWHGLALARTFHASALARLGRFPEAEEELAAALPFQEKIAVSSGSGRRWEELAVMDAGLAWLRLRQPASADTARALIPRLRRARAAAPSGERFRLTLVGLAHYRLGEADRSLAVLQQADAGDPAGAVPGRWTTDDILLRRIAEHQEEVAPAVNAFCLAMTYHRLGRRTDAIGCYQRGRHLAEAQRTPPGFRSVDVDTVRAEAEAVLGLYESAPFPRGER